MGVLVVNTFCLIFTTCSIRRLSRGTSMVERARAEKLASSRGFRSAVLYVKLLLTAGVVELAVEGVAWGARSRRFHGSSEWAEDFAAQSAFVFAIVGTCIDVARAAAVLWLCVGRCDRLSFLRSQAKASAPPAPRKVKSAPSLQPATPTPAADLVIQSPPVCNVLPSPYTETSHPIFAESPDAFGKSFMTRL
ncbi:hypothetical protein R5R35_006944 [Gryllus longicercus]|uniref:Uncharacterized protein n=1 Tax=Gryllus longicercus TaxID=2509291 RepID=A0AAN9YZ73_9ORTH